MRSAMMHGHMRQCGGLSCHRTVLKYEQGGLQPAGSQPASVHGFDHSNCSPAYLPLGAFSMQMYRQPSCRKLS